MDMALAQIPSPSKHSVRAMDKDRQLMPFFSMVKGKFEQLFCTGFDMIVKLPIVEAMLCHPLHHADNFCESGPWPATSVK